MSCAVTSVVIDPGIFPDLWLLYDHILQTAWLPPILHHCPHPHRFYPPWSSATSFITTTWFSDALISLSAILSEITTDLFFHLPKMNLKHMYKCYCTARQCSVNSASYTIHPIIGLCQLCMTLRFWFLSCCFYKSLLKMTKNFRKHIWMYNKMLYTLNWYVFSSH